ncbi:DUF4883 family protein [Clostridium tetanomorphum]|uniref:DUF4883 family protein n=1 Tax=Clostridium tetanomorphum TaxID=1553 RepID=A0A923E862_CLOTT|nr:DUF4883 family protein [Clostridium tetanomorphum]
MKLNKKNYFIIISLIIVSFIFSSCSNISIKKAKKNNFYYTNMLAKTIYTEQNYKCNIVDTNFYKGIDLSSDNFNIIKNFISSLDTKYFISVPKDLPDKPPYKMLLTFKKEKFVINIYNEKYISIHPWDGYYEMDYIDMSKIPSSYNLFNLCNYIVSKSSDS